MPNTYTEREVAQIIERAVVRQEEARRRQGAAGLSLQEIEKLGEDVGIDPEHLRAAAAEIDAGAADHESHTTTTHNHVERWTSGPLDIHDWEDAVDDLRQRMGPDYGPMYAGRTSSADFVEKGATKTWEHTSGLGVHHRVIVSERGERTRIRLEQQVGVMAPLGESIMYGLLSMLLLGPLAAGVGTFLFDGAMASAATSVLAVMLFAVASFAIYKLDTKWREKKMGQLEDLASDLAVQLAAPPEAQTLAAPEAAEPLAHSDAPPLLDLDALDVVDPGTTPRRRTRS